MVRGGKIEEEEGEKREREKAERTRGVKEAEVKVLADSSSGRPISTRVAACLASDSPGARTSSSVPIYTVILLSFYTQYPLLYKTLRECRRV